MLSYSPEGTPRPISGFMRLLASSRYLIFVAVACILIGATALLGYGAVETFTILRSIFDSPVDTPTAKSQSTTGWTCPTGSRSTTSTI